MDASYSNNRLAPIRASCKTGEKSMGSKGSTIRMILNELGLHFFEDRTAQKGYHPPGEDGGLTANNVPRFTKGMLITQLHFL